MPTDADEHLAIKNELERKYLKVLADLVADFENGTTDVKTFETAFYAVRNTVWGLVDSDDFDAICADFEEMMEKHR